MDCLYTCVVSLFWWKLILFFVTLFSFRILIGTGRVCIETLRPLAYSILAEMVHHIRMDMSMPQVALSLSLSQVSSPVFICVCSHAHKMCIYTHIWTHLGHMHMDTHAYVLWGLANVNDKHTWCSFCYALFYLFILFNFAVVSNYLPVLQKHAWLFVEHCHSNNMCSPDAESGILVFFHYL